ncbi:MAG: hypothetical protein AAF404_01470 [Pseudomonadota bacterium]
MTEFTEVAPATQIYVADKALSAQQCSDIINRFEAAGEEQYQGRCCTA